MALKTIVDSQGTTHTYDDGGNGGGSKGGGVAGDKDNPVGTGVPTSVALNPDTSPYNSENKVVNNPDGTVTVTNPLGNSVTYNPLNTNEPVKYSYASEKQQESTMVGGTSIIDKQTTIDQSQEVKPLKPEDTWKPDFTQPNPWEGMPPEYVKKEAEGFVPSEDKKVVPSLSSGQFPVGTILNDLPDKISRDTIVKVYGTSDGVTATVKEMTVEQYLELFSKQGSEGGQVAVDKAIKEGLYPKGTIFVLSDKPDDKGVYGQFIVMPTKVTTSEGKEITLSGQDRYSLSQINEPTALLKKYESLGIIKEGTYTLNQDNYDKGISLFKDYVSPKEVGVWSAEFPEPKTEYDVAKLMKGVASGEISESEFSNFFGKEALQQIKTANFQAQRSKEIIDRAIESYASDNNIVVADKNDLSVDEMQRLIEVGFNPKALVIQGQSIDKVQSAIDNINGKYKEFNEAQDKLNLYGTKLGLQINPKTGVAREQGTIPISFEQIVKFQRENPDDNTSIKTVYGQELADKVNEYNKSLKDGLEEINQYMQEKELGDKGRAIDNIFLANDITNVPKNTEFDMGAGVVKDTITGEILNSQEVLARKWNELSDSQKELVVNELAKDPTKGNLFAALNRTIQITQEKGGIIPQVIFSGVSPITNVVAKQLTIDEAREILNNSYENELKVVDSFRNNDGSVNINGLKDKLNSDLAFKEQLLKDSGYEDTDDLIKNLEYYNNGIHVTKGEIIDASVVGVLDVLALGGAGALSSLGKVGRYTVGAITVGAGAYFIPSSIQAIKSPNVGIAEKVLAGATPIMLIVGGTIGLKAPKIEVVDAVTGKVVIPKVLAKPITVRVGEAISGIKTTGRNIANTVMSAPEAIKYYSKNLGLTMEQIADVTKRGLLETTPQLARQVAENMKVKGIIVLADFKERIMTTPEAIKYYSQELGLKATQIAELAKKGLLETTPRIADKVAQDLKIKGAIVLADIKTKVMSVPDAITYYKDSLGLKVEQIAELAKKGLLEVTPELARKIAQNIQVKGAIALADLKERVMSIPEGIEYYTKELGLNIQQVYEVAKRGLLETTPEIARRIVEDIKIKSALVYADAKEHILTAPEAIEYYARELNLKAEQIIELAKKNISNVSISNVKKIVDDLKVKGVVGYVTVKERILSIPEYISYYSELYAEKLVDSPSAIADKVKSYFNEIKKAMDVKDEQTIIENARKIKLVADGIADKKLSKYWADKIDKVTDDVREYIKQPENKTQVKKINDELESHGQELSQMLDKILSDTREMRVGDIGELSPDKIISLTEDTKPYKAGELPQSEDVYKTILEDVKKSLVQPEEGGIKQVKEVAKLSDDENALLDAINNDNLRLNEIQNIVGGENEFEIGQLVSRISENMNKLSELRKLKGVELNFKDALDSKLRELGYTEKEIAELSDRQKLENVANEIRPEKSKEPFKPTIEKGGGVAVKEKVETKPETKTKVMTPEELEQLMKEKIEVKPEEKVEAKPTEKTKTDTTIKTGIDQFVIPAVEGEPYYAVVWENGQMVVRLITPEVLTQGYIELQTKKGNLLVSQQDLSRMTPEQARKLLDETDVAFFIRSSPFVITNPSKRSKEVSKPGIKVTPTTKPYIITEPKPETYPKEKPLPKEKPMPFKEVEPLKTVEPITPFKPITITEPITIQEPKPETVQPPKVEELEKLKIRTPIKLKVSGEEPTKKFTEKKVQPGTIEFKHGMFWKYLEPSDNYKTIKASRTPLPGTYKFASGIGSAYKTIQILGGRPPTDTDVDLGWAKVHIGSKRGQDLEIKFLEGDTANVNKRLPKGADAHTEYVDNPEEIKTKLTYQEPQLDENDIRNSPEYEDVGLKPADMPYTFTEKIPKGATVKKEFPRELKRTELPQYKSGRLKVYTVDAEWLRSQNLPMADDRTSVDWTQGGHSRVYPLLIPRNEIWLDRRLGLVDAKATLLHELKEYRTMGGGISYEDAHNDFANPVEIQGRKNINELDNMIKEELSYYSQSRLRPRKPTNKKKARQEPIYKEDEVSYIPRKADRQQSVMIGEPTYLGHKLRSPDLGYVNI